MTRKNLLKQIENKENKIQKLQEELRELKIKEYKFCDRNQRYEERVITIKKKQILVGEIFFDEDFVDEDTGNVITINRCQRVMENNKWFI